ncbi:MAG: hypothetical protein K0S70_4710, partial [Microbacterium sp.]|nr:hypothetical protein [Microbacterium sp.]
LSSVYIHAVGYGAVQPLRRAQVSESAGVVWTVPVCFLNVW